MRWDKRGLRCWFWMKHTNFGICTAPTNLRRWHNSSARRWRVGVFTTRPETETRIVAFLGERGITCGLINGDSGERNQRRIAGFKKPLPEIHAIVSTEAGSEGINLQAANVLVNFDLPWNPMIVEQRIGRIQRLASEHASVCIVNIILRGTFEELLSARKLQRSPIGLDSASRRFATRSILLALFRIRPLVNTK